MLKIELAGCGKLPRLRDTTNVATYPLVLPGGHGSTPNALEGTQSLYVSLLMVFLGPLRDPFFWPHIL